MACCVVGRSDATSWPGNRDLLNQQQTAQSAFAYFGQPGYFPGGFPGQPFSNQPSQPTQPNTQPTRFNPVNPAAPFNPLPGFSAPGTSPFRFGFGGANPFARRGFNPSNPGMLRNPAMTRNPGMGPNPGMARNPAVGLNPGMGPPTPAMGTQTQVWAPNPRMAHTPAVGFQTQVMGPHTRLCHANPGMGSPNPGMGTQPSNRGANPKYGGPNPGVWHANPGMGTSSLLLLDKRAGVK